jgi:prepilin-type processing-associated H-X9-DG protein
MGGLRYHNDHVLAFFDGHVEDVHVPLLGGPSEYPDVAFDSRDGCLAA